jgi:ribosome-associated toxin RatA of RatAB toxin-antitoxin module
MAKLTIRRISVLYSRRLFPIRKTESSEQKGRNLVNLFQKATAALVLAASLSCSFGLPQTFVVAANASGNHECLSEEMMHGKTYTVARVSVKASPERVWQILTDYDNAPRVFPQLRHSKLLHEHGGQKTVKHVLAPSGLPGTYEYVVEVKEAAPHSLEWHRVSGAFKQVDGYWKLEPLDGGHTTLVTYASYVDGGFLMPQPLVRRQCRIDMPAVMTTLKAQAESSSGIQIAGRPQAHGQ